MNLFYYIKTCNTSVRILKQLPIEKFQPVDIKTFPISVNQLEHLVSLAGSHAALFSKKAKKYTEMGLKNQNLNEKEYKRLLLDEYTFFKRPIIVIDNEIFIGSEKKNVEKLLLKIKNL